MGKSSQYVAKEPDANGYIDYTDDEHGVWHDLITRQLDIIQGRACQEFLDGLDILQLPNDRIPQPKEISAILMERTGWQVEPVPALINFDRFFRLLAERRFPAASFIRSREEMDYLQEPDIFHEVFGHCAMLTHPAFARFTEAYGHAGVAAEKRDRPMLARLYWFTVEFGLIQTAQGLRSYGGGINSSPGETVYALESDEPYRKPFDAIEALRTPYRIDIYQSVYYILNQMEDLYELAESDLLGLIRQARALGQYQPTFPPKEAAA
ncbi:MAG: phenylalanine 4-monooxygenase [Wenzhouxiangellaceae bacterium]